MVDQVVETSLPELVQFSPDLLKDPYSFTLRKLSESGNAGLFSSFFAGGTSRHSQALAEELTMRIYEEEGLKNKPGLSLEKQEHIANIASLQAERETFLRGDPQQLEALAGKYRASWISSLTKLDGLLKEPNPPNQITWLNEVSKTAVSAHFGRIWHEQITAKLTVLKPVS